MASRRRALSPFTLVRTRAIHRGILGSSPLWRAVAVVIFGRRLLKRLMGKNAEHLGTETLRAGQEVQIEAIAPPPTRRQRRRARRRQRRA
jgi:hypothetical protein